MDKQKTRIAIAIGAAVIVLGCIIALLAYAASLKPYKPLVSYASLYDTTVANINSNAGVYRERDYYVSTTTTLETPSNGEILINPIEKPFDEEDVPLLQRSSYTISNTTTGGVYTRLTNSKRSEEREGAHPDVALVSLEYRNNLSADSWQHLMLYNNAIKEEVVDSALVFAPATTEKALSWQGAASLYLLDGAFTNHAAALLPGVNLLNDFDDEGYATGIVYTNRSLSIGTTPSTAQDELASQALHANNLHDDEQRALLSLDMSQRITGTDLVFCAPEGKETLSSMQAPVVRSAKSNSLSMEGGVIAVGPGATLVIGQGDIGTVNPLADGATRVPQASSGVTRGTIELAPRAIIVDGGTLILSDCEAWHTVIDASIQVRNGGTLQIGNNVKINGNIYVFGDATLEILGSFELNGTRVSLAHNAEINTPQQVEQAKEQVSTTVPGGIFIFANTTLQPDGTPLGAGNFNAQLFWMIDGNDGTDVFLMSRAVHFLSAEARPGYPLMYNDYHCTKEQEGAHICPHFGAVNGVIAPEIIVGLSEDTARVEVFVTKE